MRYLTAVILLLLISWQSALAQTSQYDEDEIQQDWMKRDWDIKDSLLLVDKQNPVQVAQYFRTHSLPDRYNKNTDTLGFGWSVYTSVIAGGYTSIYATFYYYKNTIQTYSLSVTIPQQKALISRHQLLYRKLLPVESGNVFYYHYNEQNILHPLDEYKIDQTGTAVLDSLLQYMSPNSGIVYGTYGGYAGMMLQNRRCFNGIRDHITTSQVVAMMYSINPASRLTAIEYYLRHRKQFTDTVAIDQWIEKVYAEVPEINTMDGCIYGKENARLLVNRFAAGKEEW